MCKFLHEADTQKIHTTTPEQLTDQELFLTAICVTELVRKHSSHSGWDKVNPKCFFWSKVKRFRTFTVQWHITSQITVSGKHKCETVVCEFEIKKDDSPLKVRFLETRKEIYNPHTENQKTEQHIHRESEVRTTYTGIYIPC